MRKIIDTTLSPAYRKNYGNVCLILGSLSNHMPNEYRMFSVALSALTIVGMILIAYSYAVEEEKGVLEVDLRQREREKRHNDLTYNKNIVDRSGMIEDVTISETINSEINRLWYCKDENIWKKELQRYYSKLSKEELELDLELEALTAKEVESYSVDKFYNFLYEKYFIWKYGYSQYLSTYLTSLSKYKVENRMSDLEEIKNNMFSVNLINVEKCLSNAKKIHGLGVAGASGLLSIIFPEHFGTVDKFVVLTLRKVQGLQEEKFIREIKNPSSLSVKEGTILINLMRKKAKELNKQFKTDFWTPRKIDMILWHIDRKR